MSSEDSPHLDKLTAADSQSGDQTTSHAVTQERETVLSSPIDKRPRKPKQSIFRRFYERLKSDLVLAALALILAMGQYYQNGHATRIGITEIWKDGYTADTRDRVAKFTHHHDTFWVRNPKTAAESLDKLIDTAKVFDGRIIREDENLRRLLEDEVNEEEENQTNNDESDKAKQRRVNKKYSEAALKYRSAILECLNTLEAVKAVIDGRPLPIRVMGNPDRLEERYKWLIVQRTKELLPFIYKYREHNPRPIAAWHILTQDTDAETRKELWLWATGISLVLLGIIAWVAYENLSELKAWGRRRRRANANDIAG
jgi:hypothetical protein